MSEDEKPREKMNPVKKAKIVKVLIVFIIIMSFTVLILMILIYFERLDIITELQRPAILEVPFNFTGSP